MIVKGEMCSAVEACLASLLHQVLGNTALRQVNFAFFPVTHSPPFYLSVYLGSIIHCRVYRSNLSIDLSIDLYIDLSIHPSIDRSIMAIYISRDRERETERQRDRERERRSNVKSSFHIVRFTQIGCCLQEHLQRVRQQHSIEIIGQQHTRISMPCPHFI
jgi:hypothetical protein